MACGYFFFEERYYCGENIIAPILELFGEINPEHQSTLNKFNGSWAIVVNYENTNKVILATDRYRSIPLFYMVDKGISISDNFMLLEDYLKKTDYDRTSELQFLLSGYISGSNTLIKSVSKVEPGTIVTLSEKGIESSSSYFVHFPNLGSVSDKIDLELELKKRILGLKNRIVKVCKNKRVFVPLSGGNDSRLILWLLYESGIKNVICYTYGVKSNPQRNIASRIAERLGYEWYFIDYTRTRWQKDLLEEDLKEFLLFSSNGTSLPHIQDYPAVKELHRLGLITESSIFLPGHVGDAWASEFASEDLSSTYPHPPQEYHSEFLDIFNSKVVSFLIYRHFMFFPVSKRLWNTKEYSNLIERVKNDLKSYKSYRSEEIWLGMEWILRNRTCLWIVNSIRTYEYFGSSYFLPLADYDLINFFRGLPMQHVIDRNLYSKVLKELFSDQSYEASKKLFDIEVLSGGTRKKGLKRKIINLLKTLRIYHPIERIRHSKRAERNLNFEHWFTNGKRSENVRVIEILQRANSTKYLPSYFLKVLQPYFTKPSYTLHCNGILSVIFMNSFKEYFESK